MQITKGNYFNLEADRRVDAGKGGYMIHVSNNTKLDSYDTCRRGECKASKANSSTNVFNSITGTMAINNASIVVSTSVAGGTRVDYKHARRFQSIQKSLQPMDLHSSTLLKYYKYHPHQWIGQCAMMM